MLSGLMLSSGLEIHQSLTLIQFSTSDQVILEDETYFHVSESSLSLRCSKMRFMLPNSCHFLFFPLIGLSKSGG
jgi:hypothetical protein